LRCGISVEVHEAHDDTATPGEGVAGSENGTGKSLSRAAQIETE